MKKTTISDIAKELRTPAGFERAMKLVSAATSPPQRLRGGTLRRYIFAVVKIFAPGEKAIMTSLPLDYDFQLEYVMVPEDVCFDGGEARFFLHHDGLVPDAWKPGSGAKLPACLCLAADSKQVQLMDIYKKHVYAKGEVFELGIFENTSDAPLEVKAAVVGIVRTDGER